MFVKNKISRSNYGYSYIRSVNKKVNCGIMKLLAKHLMPHVTSMQIGAIPMQPKQKLPRTVLIQWP